MNEIRFIRAKKQFINAYKDIAEISIAYYWYECWNIRYKHITADEKENKAL